jgi:transcriptional regulator with XRE-family HTH domain
MTLEDLAKKTGVATTTISRYENGNCHMNLNMLERIVNGNGQTLEIFFANVLAKMQ